VHACTIEPASSSNGSNVQLVQETCCFHAGQPSSSSQLHLAVCVCCWQVLLPLELVSRIRCRWKDGEFYRCKILERRIKPDLEPRLVAANDPAVVWEYYVHFSGSE
jgi:hypothetical protein